jgi:tRNA(Ile)-lysidine synthase
MLKEFKKFIVSEDLFLPKERILLAVSGGKDSVVLTELFRLSGFAYGIAHCNFQLRGDDSEKDELFVASLAKRNNVPFYSTRFLTLQTAEARGISIQMAARELRYEWFREILQKEKYNYVATAHHLDDQVETFFINLMRSTGIAGFHGIFPKQGNVIRPMLFTNRKNIETFVKENSISYREDKSNNETKYLRNKIRHEILPVLQEIHPAFEHHLTENIQRIREVESIFRESIELKRKKIVKKEKDKTRIPISEIKKLNPVGTYLFEFLSPFGFNFSQIKDLLKTLEKTSGKIMLSPTHRLIKDRENILLTLKPKASSKSDAGNQFLVPENTVALKIPLKLSFQIDKKVGNYKIDTSSKMAFLDKKNLVFPLVIRKWQRGDFFYPFGRNHRKKLSDYFVDEKFSLLDKENTWVLCSGKEIIWVVGHRIDNRFRISSQTKEVLKIKLTR